MQCCSKFTWVDVSRLRILALRCHEACSDCRTSFHVATRSMTDGSYPHHRSRASWLRVSPYSRNGLGISRPCSSSDASSSKHASNCAGQGWCWCGVWRAGGRFAIRKYCVYVVLLDFFDGSDHSKTAKVSRSLVTGWADTRPFPHYPTKHVSLYYYGK